MRARGPELPVEAGAVRILTLFLMSSSSAARMSARLPVTWSLIADRKAASVMPDISSVITPPLRGQDHRESPALAFALVFLCWLAMMPLVTPESDIGGLRQLEETTCEAQSPIILTETQRPM